MFKGYRKQYIRGFVSVFIICFFFVFLSGCEGAEEDEENDNTGNDNKPVVSTDAIAFYKFEELEGTRAENSASNRFDGTIVAAVRTIGNDGNALDFSVIDGSHVHIDACCEDNPGSNSISFPNDSITLAMWLRPSSLSIGTIYPIFGGSYEGIQSFKLRVTASGTVELLVYTHGNGQIVSVVSSNLTLQNGSWTHIAVTYDGTNAILYLNGSIHSQGAITMPIENIVNDFYIGGIPAQEDAGGGAHSFPGVIDELIVFDSALDADEILDLLG